MAPRDELFWPSLYGRLAPSRYAATPGAAPADEDDYALESHFVDFETLRRQIATELRSLLNATSLEAALLGAQRLTAERADQHPDDIPLDRYPFAAHPEIRASIINYGLPAFIGRNVYDLPLPEVEERLREAILAFEPRIDPDQLQVRVTNEAKNGRISPDHPLRFTVRARIFGANARDVGLLIDTIWDPDKMRTGVLRLDQGG